MAPKKKTRASARTRSRSTRGKSKRTVKRQAQRRFPGLVSRLILLAVLGLPLAFIYLFPLPSRVKFKRPVFEDFREIPSESEGSGKPSTGSQGMKLPAVAILIDDMGYDMGMDRDFIMLDSNLSFAFLPLAPFSKKLASLAASMGHDVLVHVPMEPMDHSIDPGPGLLSVEMSESEITAMLKKDLDAIPVAKGINNHMGSRFTADWNCMRVVMRFLKGRGLFFIDSRTTKDTVAIDVAKEMGVPCAQRSLFLDHDISEKSIKMQFSKVVKMARSKGKIIVIGHPHPSTYKVLYEGLPWLKKHVKIVPVHSLVH